MKDHAERVPATGAQTAHAVPQIDAIEPDTLHRAVVHGEDDAVTRPSGTTSARDCIVGRCAVSTNSPPEVLLWIGQEDRRLEREDVLAGGLPLPALLFLFSNSPGPLRVCN